MRRDEGNPKARHCMSKPPLNLSRLETSARTRRGIASPVARPRPLSSERSYTAVVRGWTSDVTGAWFMAALVWVATVYLVVPPGLYSLENSTIQEGWEPNPFFRTIKLFLLGASGLLILWRAGLAWLMLKSTNVMFLLCLALIAASPLWSIDPNASTARVVSLSSTFLVCFAFVLLGWHPKRVQNVVRPVVTGLLIGSIILGILFPDLAIEAGEGTLKDAWRGLTFQKNQLGILASLGTVFWLHALLTKETRFWPAIGGMFVSLACVVLSRSSTSLLATALTSGFIVLMLYMPGSLRRFMPYIVGTFATTVVLYALAVLNLIPGLDVILTSITDFFGKDMTFSNRSAIWALIEEHIRLHPALGTGYGAYWTGPVPSSASYELIEKLYFYPSESHNGYLEVANDLGLVGLGACIGYFIVYVRQCLRLILIERNQAVLYLGIFFQNAVGNLSESYWLQNHFAFLILTLATFGIARAFLDQRLQQVFGARTASGVPAHP